MNAKYTYKPNGNKPPRGRYTAQTMSRTVLAASRIIGPAEGRWIAIEDGRIHEVGQGQLPSGAEELPGYLAPGFIDLQVNGIGDVDFADANPDGWLRAQSALLSHGVTGFFPTLISAPLDSYSEKLERAHSAKQARGTATVLGVHLEGPFLGGAPGAHPKEFLRAADPAWLADQLETYPALVSIVTLAPEADPDFKATRLLAQSSVVVAIGHSTATYDQARAAADAGATVVTHLFNAMAPFDHRDPGPVGAALDDDRLTPTLIADLVHVHPAGLRLAIQRKKNVAIISDAVASDSKQARGLGVRVVDGAPRLPDGTLAGSVLTLDIAIANLVRIGISLERAVEMASTIPAEMLGLADRGAIEVGRRADLVLLDSQSCRVLAVWLEGERVHG